MSGTTSACSRALDGLENQMTLDDLQSALLSEFADVSRLSGINLPASQMQFERLPAPHSRPSELPVGKCAVYGFLFRGRCLKVGKVGPRSGARFCSHHYVMGSSQSNLAKTILANKPVIAGLVGTNEAASIEALDEVTIGPWLETSTARFHILCPQEINGPALSLLEAFVQCRLDPLFEGVNPAIKVQGAGLDQHSVVAPRALGSSGGVSNVYLAIQETLRTPELLDQTERKWIQNFAVVLDRLPSGGHLSPKQSKVALDIYDRFCQRVAGT
jgi:hypothetical protein